MASSARQRHRPPPSRTWLLTISRYQGGGEKSCHSTVSLQLVRSVQPEGPIYLAGYSFGGVVAFELALQLEAAGSLASLILLDGSHSYVQGRTGQYMAKINGDMDLGATEAMIAFINQFMVIDYTQVYTILHSKFTS